MQDNSFDKNIKHQLDGLQFVPSQNVWDAVEKELDKKKRRYFFAWWLLPLLMITAGIFLFLNNEHNNGNKKTITIETQKNTPASFERKILEKPNQTINQNQAKEVIQPKLISTTEKQREDKAFNKLKTIIAKANTKVKIIAPSTYDENAQHNTVNKRKVESKTIIAIRPAIAKADDETKLGNLDIVHDDTSSLTLLKDVEFKANDSAAIIKSQVEIMKEVKLADTLDVKEFKKEKGKLLSKWDKQWSIGGGYGGLTTLKIGGSANDLLYDLGGINSPGSGNGIRTGNKYAFNTGIYFNTGLSFNRKLTSKIKFETGLQYNFQYINVTRKYMVDSVIFSSTPSSTNISSTTYKEVFIIHAFDIPALVKVSLSKKIILNTGLFNRIQFSSQWHKYAQVLGNKKTYLPVFHFNPEYNFKNFSIGPAVNIGLTKYSNGSRLTNIGLLLKYSFKK